MAKTKHEKTYVDYDKPYETNIVGLRGVIIFAGGLFLMVIITFGLMYVLENTLEDQAVERDKQNINPMTQNMKPAERLPPEPRLQVAPGFGVDLPDGRVNLELKDSQSEYNTLHVQWEKLWKDGQKDAKTGTVISLPIEEAKQKLLQENVKANPDGQQELEDSRRFYSYSSAGRLESDKRR
ncbi:MAG: hypothetical protein ACR2LT_04240 [Pyrinomonadaceae bacterium]